jgi:asparagine synthase (glutamine-hydrolysing)
MCGICGFANLDKGSLPSKDLLKAMNDTLSKRGPDDEGFFYGDFVALAQRRLSIIDLAGGHQPLFNEDSTISIVFNGEIYNFPELRQELEATGRHCFSTNSDTEVIIHLYEDMGPECLKKLNGMFAFALWDSNKEILFCARDRMGQKPFYYSIQDNIFLFGSELKALLKHPSLSRDISPLGLSRYLAFEYVPAPLTIFENVYKLEPGHYFCIDFAKNPGLRKDIKTAPYWDLKFDKIKCSFKDAENDFIEIYQAAVKRRLISDVPLGVFLSGGIDSSSVVAMMAQVMPPKEIKTFCIAFQEKSFDESSWARKVADYFGTDHREECLPPERLLEILPVVSSFLDEPMADPSIIPTYLLSEFTRKHVTVALGGDGGDELFAGYDPFVAHNPARIVGALPRPIIKGMQKIAGLLPVSTKNISFDFKIKQFLAGFDYDYGERHFAWLGSFAPNRQDKLLSSDYLESVSLDSTYDVIKNYLKKLDIHHNLDGIIYLYCKLYLQDDILVKVDRASMACSLETRAPFMDPNVVEYVNSLPNSWKLKGFKTKYILKKAMERFLPRDIIYRKKKGFGIPIAEWFKGPLKKSLIDLLEPSRIKEQGFFNPVYVQNLMNQHFEGKKDNRKLLWTLYIFQNWYNNYMM